MGAGETRQGGARVSRSLLRKKQSGVLGRQSRPIAQCSGVGIPERHNENSPRFLLDRVVVWGSRQGRCKATQAVSIDLWQRSAVATVGGSPWRADRPLLAHSTTATLPVRLHAWRSTPEVEKADRLLIGGPPI